MNSSDSPRERAQTSPLGIALIVGITITAAVMIVFVGSAALETTQDESRIGQAEQAMTQFDSMASKVALGDSKSQNVRIGQQGGNYRVDEDAGTIEIYHEDWDENLEDEYDDEIIFGPKPLGAVVYNTGDTEIAYQGGGVWRSGEEGVSTMVSPPEFHYRQATLTFPIIRVSGSGSRTGDTTAQVTQQQVAQDIYPNPGEFYPDGDREYLNPVQDGNMTVRIQSEYCAGWRSYFEERTEGEVSECDEDGTVTAQLITLGTQGDFDIMKGSNLQVRGQPEEDPLNDFELEFESDSNSGFNNFEWKMYSDDSSDRAFEIYIEATEGGGDGEPVHMHVFFSEDDGDNYHSWVISSDDTDAFTIEDEKEDATLVVDLLNASRDITYEDFGDYDLSQGGGPNNGAGPVYSSGDGDFIGDEEFGEEEYEEGDREQLDTVMQYYFGQAGDLDMSINERQQGGAGLSDSSTGTITYAGGGRVVTFLHVTENEVRVELK